MSFFNKFSLSLQLTMIFWLVFLVIVTTIGIYDYNRQISNIKQSKLNSLTAVSKSISIAITEDIYTNDYAALEQVLLGLNEINEIYSIRLYDEDKTILSEIIRNDDGQLTPTYQYGNAKEAIPNELIAYNADDSLIVRMPIRFSGKNIAWIEFISNKEIITKVRGQVYLELLFLCGVILIITFLGVLFFLKQRLRSLKELISFSEQLPLAHGKTVSIHNAPAEFHSLAHTLNWASKEIEEQNLQLHSKNKSLEQQVKERTKEFEAAKNTAEKASMAKTDFLSRMSHELRTPMNAILGFGQILALKSSGLNEQQHKHTTEILNAGNHLLTLINDILDLATIESGNMNASMQAVPLDKILKQCTSLIKHQAKKRQLTVTDKTINNKHLVYADPLLLKQVLINLLSNAVKYNNKHGKILIDSEVINNEHLRISISDTGPGLSEGDIGKLFSSFERLNASSRIEGTGIGLVITKHLTEAMGGIIGVDSILGEGARFWVELSLFDDSLTSTGQTATRQ